MSGDGGVRTTSGSAPLTNSRIDQVGGRKVSLAPLESLGERAERRSCAGAGLPASSTAIRSHCIPCIGGSDAGVFAGHAGTQKRAGKPGKTSLYPRSSCDPLSRPGRGC
jgi:hypothetical protein